MKAPKVVAEIGCNHQGNLDTAKGMIDVAASFCKADYVKFQKRHPRELLTPAQYDAPHPNSANAFGTSYGKHREFLEFDRAQHAELKAYCAEKGIGYACSVWDLTSAHDIAALAPDYIKIPSASNQHWEMLGWLCDAYGGALHVSLGMTTRVEEARLVRFFEERGRARDLVLYACTSGYPVAFDDLCLFEVSRLIETYGEVVKSVGFSGHHLGIAADVAAFTLGATWIERHYTLDRTWKGTDHAASLEPDGLRRLKRDLEAVGRALTRKPRDILAVEEPQREKLKWVPDGH